MKIRLEGLSEFGIADGEYDLDPSPSTREFTRFRKEAGLSPSEMQDAVVNGGLEVVPFYVYTALQRAGEPGKAAGVIDIPFDRWAGMKVVTDERAEEEEEHHLPLPIANDEPETSGDELRSSGLTSHESSDLPA